MKLALPVGVVFSVAYLVEIDPYDDIIYCKKSKKIWYWKNTLVLICEISYISCALVRACFRSPLVRCDLHLLICLTVCDCDTYNVFKKRARRVFVNRICCLKYHICVVVLQLTSWYLFVHCVERDSWSIVLQFQLTIICYYQFKDNRFSKVTIWKRLSHTTIWFWINILGVQNVC